MTIITQTAGNNAIQFGQVTGGTITIAHDKPDKAARQFYSDQEAENH
jgi:hypothetical protein